MVAQARVGNKITPLAKDQKQLTLWTASSTAYSSVHDCMDAILMGLPIKIDGSTVHIANLWKPHCFSGLQSLHITA